MSDLNKLSLEVPLGQGLETDIDPKLLPVGKVTTLENCLWTESGEATKRPGYVPLGVNFITQSTPGSMPVPWQMGQRKGVTLSLSQAGSRPIGAYAPSVNEWTAPPALAADGLNGAASKLRGPVIAKQTPVFRSTITTGSVLTLATTACTDGTYIFVVWEESDPASALTVNVRIIEVSTGNILFQYNLGTGRAPRAVQTNGVFTVLWWNGTNISEVHWLSSAIAAGNGAVSSATVIATDNIGTVSFDAIVTSTNILILYAANLAPSGGINRITYAAGNPGGAVTQELLSAIGTRIVPGTFGWVRDLGLSGKQAIHNSNFTGGLTVHWDYTTTTAAGSTQLDATAGPYFAQEVHTVSNAGAGEFSAIYQIATSPIFSTFIAQKLIASGTASRLWNIAANLISTAFSWNGDFYVLTANVSTLQGMYFVNRVPHDLTDAQDFTFTPSARFATGQGKPADGTLTDVSALGSGFLAACAVRTQLIELPHAGGPTNQFDFGVDRLTITFNPTVSNGREYADSFYCGGGLLGQWDGAVFAEEGFHVYPETVTVAFVSSGTLSPVPYEWVCTYKYNDNNGRVHRSNPSVPLIATPTAGQAAQVTCKTLKFHGRPGQVAIEFWRTTANESAVWFLVGQVPNVETNDTVTFLDNQPDTSLAFAQQLYTDGNVIGNGPPPSALAMAIFNGRLAVVSPEDPTLVVVSMPLVDGQGPSFDVDQVSSFRIADAHGDIVGLAGMDDKLIAFKADAIYMVNGTGPDATGNGTWGIPQYVSIGIGCTNVRSILETPDGIMFHSTSGKSGTYLINRGLAVQYIGAPVQAYLADPIVDAVFVPKQNRAHFFTSSGRTQVYDWAQSKLAGQNIWTTFVNQPAACCGLYNGLPVYQTAGQSAMGLLAEDSTGTQWDENGVENQQYILPPWLSVNGLKGYARFYLMQGVGKYMGPHILTVTMYTDFNDATPFATWSILVDPAGGILPSPTDWNAWEAKHPCKASAVRFGIRISSVGGGPGNTQGANMSAYVIRYGQKQGLRKVAGSNRLT